MRHENLNKLRLEYKESVDQWLDTIRAEEAMATPDHLNQEWENWDAAGFAEKAAQKKARAARDAYKDALREITLGF